MTKHIVLSVTLLTLVVAGLFYRFSPSQSTKFLTFEYNQKEWVTTENTIYKKIIGLSSFVDSNYESLPKGIQLKPILRYDSNNVIAELPNGRRVIVVASTLSGLKAGDYINDYPRSTKKLSDVDLKKHTPSNTLTNDSTMLCLGFMPSSYYYDKYESRNSKTSSQTANFKMVGIVTKYRDSYGVTDATNVTPDFIRPLPKFNRDFIKYISAKKLEKMTRAKVDKKYGEPVTVEYNQNGDTVCFYRHLRSKQNYYKNGLFIVYGKDGTTSVLNSEAIKNTSDPLFVRDDYRPIISGFTGLDWVDLPLAYFAVRSYYLNREPISYIKPLRLADNIIWGIFIGYIFPLLLPILIIYALANLLYVILAPIKALSNSNIEMITLVITAPIMTIVMVQLFENLPALWIFIAVASIYTIIAPWIMVSGYLEFERCDVCRSYNQVTYTKNLIDVKTSTRVETEVNTEVEMSDRYDGPKRNIVNDSSGDFDDYNERTTTKRRTTRKIRVTDSKFRYHFHCHNCGRKWCSVSTERDEKVISSKTRKIGETVERVR